MIFSSLEFLFLFLPITVIIYYLCLAFKSPKIALASLFLASIFYYGYWNFANLWIILASIIWNYSFGLALRKYSFKLILLIIGLLGNILCLSYFKYTDFLISTSNILFNTNISLTGIILPIGISFFTFQQIAYLVDIYTNKKDAFPLSCTLTKGQNFLDYCLFVCFFPQLVAGPIVHHSEMMPQFASNEGKKVQWENIYKGLVFLAMGLAKKVIIADTLSPIVGYYFDTANSLTFVDALFACLCYTMQLYFDFSGYADMAIGCALFFNIQLPYNFNSPYKATSIQDFWRRWHMTLSRWLREYIYIPLGGSRKSENSTLLNLFITFLIGGIWHGANWTFIFWGFLHGLATIIHRLWTKLFNYTLPTLIAWALTFSFVSLAWIPFRTINLDRLGLFIDAFMLKNGLYKELNANIFTFNPVREIIMIGGKFWEYVLFAFIALFIALLAKNSQEIVKKLESKILLFATNILLIFVILLQLVPNEKEEFIYFQF